MWGWWWVGGQVGTGSSQIREGERQTEGEREGKRDKTRSKDEVKRSKARERKVRVRDDGSASQRPDLSGEFPDPLKEGGTSETAGHLGE